MKKATSLYFFPCLIFALILACQYAPDNTPEPSFPESYLIDTTPLRGTIADTVLAAKYLTLANYLVDSMKYDSALVWVEKATSVYSDYPGSSDSLLILSLKTQSAILFELKQFDLGFKTIEKVDSLATSNRLQNHPIQARIYKTWADGFDLKGNFQEAQTYLKKGLTILDENQGSFPSLRSKFLGAIAVSYSNLGQYQESINYFEQNLALLEKDKERNIVDLAKTYNNIGVVHNDLRDHKRSIAYIEKGLELNKQIYGQKHRRIAEGYMGIGIANKNLGRYDQALENYRKAENIMLEVLGMEHPRTGDIYLNLGVVSMSKGANDRALEYFRISRDIYSKTLGNEHLRVAFINSNMGMAFHQKGKDEKSIEYFLEALPIYEKVIGNQHPFFGSLTLNIGISHYVLGLYDLAEDYLFQAADIYTNALGADNPYMSLTYDAISELYTAQDNLLKALNYKKKALEIRIRKEGATHPLVARSYADLGKIYTLLGYNQLAQNSFTNAEKILAYRPNQTSFEHCVDHTFLRTTFLNKISYYEARQKEEPLTYRDSLTQQYEILLALEDYLQGSYERSSTRSTYAENALPVYEGAIDHLLTSAQPNEIKAAFELVEKTKSRQLREHLQFSANSRVYGIPDSIIQQENNLAVEIGSLQKEIYEGKYGEQLENN